MCDAEKDLVEKLKSANTSVVQDALVKIRKCYLRNRHKIKQLLKYSVIELIIPFLEHPKFCNISLSIISDGCVELDFVNEVIKYNGINSLMRIMKSFVSEDIQNRACRALGNIARFEVGFNAVHHMKPVSSIIHFLSDTSNEICQQTAVRTLMILGKSSKTRAIIIQENGILCIAKFLHSSNVKLLICSIEAIAYLTQNCSLSCARQLLDFHFFKVLVELHSHTEKSVQNHALIALKNLSSQEEVRSGLVKVGAIKLFTEVLSSSESHKMSRLAALALCSCLDHIHMWSHNGTERAVGLKALLLVLQNQRYQDIHLRVIESLIPLAYESKVSELLIKLDVLHVLIKILELFIEKHKCHSIINFSCKSFFSSNQNISESRIDIDEYVEDFNPELQLGIPMGMHPKYVIMADTEITGAKEDNFKKPQDISPKTVNKWEHSLCSFNSITSDYSSSYSPNRTCSPVQKFSTSPEINYDQDDGSPSSGFSSSSTPEGEHLQDYTAQWSSIVSTYSNSTPPEKEALLKEEKNDLSELSLSPTKGTFSSNLDKMEDLKEVIRASVDYDCAPSTSKSDNQVKLVHKLQNKNIVDEIAALDPRKKLKIENINQVGIFEYQSKNSSELNDSDSHAKDISVVKHLGASKQPNDCTKMQRIDNYVLLFIRQLSFHFGTNTNSQIADKFCFSALIDYLHFIHNPNPKAKQVLSNLIKNRYCFPKLIVNGFISELEDKLTSLYSCICHSGISLTYTELINLGREEAESNYGVGTLAHILVTSEKLGKLHATCAVSKLITEKSSLYRLLFHAKGLSLLLSFLSDSDVIIRRRAMVSVCEIYQSLTKDQKSKKCCFLGTCTMKTSSACSYKESFLNVVFSVRSGAKILANREKICENSEYFSALLKGNFLEKNAEIVSLPDISAENLSAIFHFLHGCGSGSFCPYIKRIPFAVLLELLSVCDRFLLLNIKAFVEDRLCHCFFPSTVPKIYKQSKIYNSPALAKRTLDFALNMNPLQKDILFHCFEELINIESNINFISDIESLINSLF